MLNNKIFFNSLKIVVLILCIATLISLLLPGGDISSKTFSGFFEYIQKVPTVTVYDFLNDAYASISVDWGVFNFFRDFLNFFSDLFRGINLLGKYISLGVRSFLFFVKYFMFG